ncbi:LysM domain protein [Akanthomyces lecanii RCEF 1005]|uniref:LysM domain protein n=1 Tax=Akanthomyces lecanii RCEF 1005 TaxID=1081108 RepID=A0A168KDU8_CORDF|nr:LysM domain protein [Akanthomyces lecanii RCEF 1005]
MRQNWATGAVVGLAIALAAAEDASSAEGRWGTLTSSPSMPFDPKTKQPCALWYNNDGDESCADVVSETWTDMVDFLRWNPSIDGVCENFKKGQSYCLDARAAEVGTSSSERPTSTTTKPATTTQPDNGIMTPSPTQPGMVANCGKFTLVRRYDKCEYIAQNFGISLQDFLAWNPKVGKDCAGLETEKYACVSVSSHVTSTATSSTTTASTTEPATTTTAGNGIETPQPTQPGMVTDCNKFYRVSKGDTCDKITSSSRISPSDFARWNPNVGDKCTGLWADTYACVGVVGGPPPIPSSTTTTTTTAAPTWTMPSNGIATPQPTQPGMVGNCVKFHYISKGNTCDQITSYQQISQRDFARWNPNIGESCTGMWADAYACVGIAAFSLKTKYHGGCTGDVYNNVVVKPGEGYCMNTDCQVGSLDIDADGLCPDGEVQLSYWEQPGCVGQWYGYGYADKGACRGLWTNGDKFKAIHLRCARKEDDCVSKGSCTCDFEPQNKVC